MNNRFLYALLTLGPLGYANAPGTLATLCTLPLVYYLHYLGLTQTEYLCVIGMSVLIAFLGIYVCIGSQQSDPSEIVIDELIGCLITFWGIPFTPIAVLIGFLLFRFFDITKVGGLKSLEQLPNPWGIVLDDVMAGIISNGILRILCLYLDHCMR
jgi:phosphatidylglycerophosphatase A